MTDGRSAGRLLARRRKTVVAIVLVLLFGTALGGSLSLFALNRPTGAPARTLLVEKGSSVGRIARQLRREGLIRSARFLQLLAVVTGASGSLTAGEHPFHGGMTAWQVLDELQVPRDVTKDVTIPEGLRKEKALAMVAQALDLDLDDLLDLAADRDFCRSLGIDASDLEGYLFPETYRFSLAMDERKVLELLVDHFFRAFDDELRRSARRLGMSTHEVATMASIIEGEARVDSERAVISAVYHNRLAKGMRLQADPTVQYALPDGPRRLFYKDYEVDSPYNTYRHHGLPPGPIGSAGRASLEAAVAPADAEYLYFVARGDGSHVFSRTASEHEAAKRATRAARRQTWKRPVAR